MVIVRGSHYESPSVVVSGDIVFSLPEPVTVKRISLKLTGKYKLDFLEVLEQANNTVANPVKEERTIFECVWDNLLVSPEGSIKIGTNELQLHPSQRFDSSLNLSLSATPVRNKLIRSQSQNLHLQVPDHGFSGTPFDNLLIPSGTLFQLPNGNYELPFQCILPGDVPETVEGLLAGSILYKFEASIERYGFNKSTVSRHQYFRILRTLSNDNLSLNETISIGNNWPDKIQYEVSIPSRAIPIGGKTPVNILLIPLIKGLKVGLIKAQIVQYYVFKGEKGEVYNDESIPFDSTMEQMNGHELNDKISIDSFISIPSNLKKITQDCDFKTDLIKVRHKLKLTINLIMPNGNISELRANLPIILYISPNVEMSGRKILLDKNGKIHFRKEAENLFERSRNNNSLMDESNEFIMNDESNRAPPNYQEHVHDRIIFIENNNNLVQQQHSDIIPINVGDFENINNVELKKHDELDKKINEIPSYDYSVDNNFNPNGEIFAPAYKQLIRRRDTMSTMSSIDSVPIETEIQEHKKTGLKRLNKRLGKLSIK